MKKWWNPGSKIEFQPYDSGKKPNSFDFRWKNGEIQARNLNFETFLIPFSALRWFFEMSEIWNSSSTFNRALIWYPWCRNRSIFEKKIFSPIYIPMTQVTLLAKNMDFWNFDKDLPLSTPGCTNLANFMFGWLLELELQSPEAQCLLVIFKIIFHPNIRRCQFDKVHIIWEGHKILRRNLHLAFVLCSASQK